MIGTKIGRSRNDAKEEALMSVANHADNLSSAVRYALETTRAIAVCPFHFNSAGIAAETKPVQFSLLVGVR